MGDKVNDQELSELLDDTLGDFNQNKPPVAPNLDDSLKDDYDDQRLEEQFFKDDPIAARFASELENLSKELEKNPEKTAELMGQLMGEDSTAMLEAMQKLSVDASASSSIQPQASPSSSNTQPKTVDDTLNEMKKNAEAIKDPHLPGLHESESNPMLADEVYMENMVKELEGLTEGADFMPMLEGLMQSLLNKDLIYDPLVNMSKSYPPFLNENKSISPEDRQRYEKQLEYCNLIIAEYDQNANMNEEQFTKVLDLVSKLQECGQPPEELAAQLSAETTAENGEPMPGFPFNNLTTLQGSQQGDGECLIM
eukprot:Nk52_evm28s2133 gene=Nk52_evmTU28s2133